MSSMSTIYDAIYSILASTFPDHKEMDDPYNPDLNNDRLLNQSYGFYIAGGLNSDRVLDCSLSIERRITVNLTRIVRGTERDTAIRKVAEKQLVEDHILLLKAFVNNTALDSVQSVVANFSYESDNGIEFVFTEKSNFLLITSTFALEYLENTRI